MVRVSCRCSVCLRLCCESCCKLQAAQNVSQNVDARSQSGLHTRARPHAHPHAPRARAHTHTHTHKPGEQDQGKRYRWCVCLTPASLPLSSTPLPTHVHTHSPSRQCFPAQIDVCIQLHTIYSTCELFSPILYHYVTCTLISLRHMHSHIITSHALSYHSTLISFCQTIVMSMIHILRFKLI